MTFAARRPRARAELDARATTPAASGASPACAPAGRAEVAGAEAALWRYAGRRRLRRGAGATAPLTVSARGPAGEPGRLRRPSSAGSSGSATTTWRRALPRRAVTPGDQRRRGRRDARRDPAPARARPRAPVRGRRRRATATSSAPRSPARSPAAGSPPGSMPRRRATTAAAQRAADALASSRALADAARDGAEGDYPKVLWQYADAVAGDGTLVGRQAG